MTRGSTRNSIRIPRAWTGVGGSLLLLSLAVLSGCRSVPVEQQRLVSRPFMLFSDSAVFSPYSRVLPQIEPGLTGSGGAKATTCTSCR